MKVSSGSATATSADALRRVPQQARSRALIERVLDTAERLLATEGVEALTTTRIAAEADVAVGSLYQYFPDKRAVVQALTMRNLDAFSVEVERIFIGDAPNGWREAVDRVIDAYLQMLDEVPGFGRIRFGDVVDTHLLDPEDDNDAVIAAKLSQLFAKSYRVPHSEELQLAFWIVVEVSDALIKLALRLDDQQRATVLGTARTVVASILCRHMDASTT